MMKKHIPVMLEEVMHYLQPEDGKIYVDATFGAGGYTMELLERAKCMVYAIDRDPNVQVLAEELANKYQRRLNFLPGCFSQMKTLLAQHNITKVDGIILDLGVSSMQLDNQERGFSFAKEAYLDMRMSCEGLSAYEVVNFTKEEDLANIIYKYGQEHKSRQIASKICYLRQKAPITTTTQLASIVRMVVKKSNQKIDVATKTFQAIRIFINQELEELEQALEMSLSLLNKDAKLIVVTFHSLEDSIVKKFIEQQSGKHQGISRYLPQEQVADNLINFKVLTKKAIKPSEAEIKLNPRARSAKLRAAQRAME
jgi:16S rRNA (cytosine1402-N4)-methyltransferase